MDPQKPPSVAAPMDKQEVVKDDGRTLIYYTFPVETGAAPDEDAEAAHV